MNARAAAKLGLAEWLKTIVVEGYVRPSDGSTRPFSDEADGDEVILHAFGHPPTEKDVEHRPYAAVRSLRMPRTAIPPVDDEDSFDAETQTMTRATHTVEGDLLVYVATEAEIAGEGDGADLGEEIIDAIEEACTPDLEGGGPHDLRVIPTGYGADFRYSFVGDGDAPLELVAKGICNFSLHFRVRGVVLRTVSVGGLQPDVDVTSGGFTDHVFGNEPT